MRVEERVSSIERQRSGRRFHGAFSLIECLAYIAMLAVVLTLALAAFYRVDVQSKHLGRNAADIVRAVQAGERWREDVRSATGPLRVTGNGAAAELHLPGARGEVAYVFRDGAVWRRGQGATRWVEFLADVKSSQMAADPRTQVSAWKWELELQSTQKVARVQPLFTFQAAAAAPTKP